MHRRGLALLLCFLVAIVVVGGGGVRAPWLPETRSAAPDVTGVAIVDHGQTTAGRVRME